MNFDFAESAASQEFVHSCFRGRNGHVMSGMCSARDRHTTNIDIERGGHHFKMAGALELAFDA